MKSRRQPELPLIEPAPLPAPVKREAPKGKFLPLDHPERPRNRGEGDLGKYLYPTPTRAKP
jgi:hypothetical protein